MNAIIPLAGPDFLRPDGQLKALTPFAGQPLLRQVLDSRPWAQYVSNYTFVLHDSPQTRAFVDNHISQWYPASVVIFISNYTRGAACSALAGVACQENPSIPLVVDLADILYKSNLDVSEKLNQSPLIGGIALTFKSFSPQYSYLRCDEAGKLLEAREKQVISLNASAGTYIFRSSALYLGAVAHAFVNESSQSHNGLFYVCPLFNGLLASGVDVDLEPVWDVTDIKNED